MTLNKHTKLNSITLILLNILEHYPNIRIKNNNKDFATEKSTSPLLLNSNALDAYKFYFIGHDDDLHINSSAGQSMWSEIPWIRLYYNDMASTAKKGIYLVYLFDTEHNKSNPKVYLSLNMGVTDLQSHKFNAREFHLITKYYYDLLNNNDLLNSSKFTRSNVHVGPINLELTHNSTKTPKGYELGNIISIEYSEDYLENSEKRNNKKIDYKLKDDLDNMISLYKWLRHNKSQKLQLLYNNDVPSRDNNFGARNIIYYGAPGVGKSFKVNDLVHNGPNVFRTTFYPDYDYANFVGQIMPDVDETNKSVNFEFVPGPFSQALEFAYHYPHVPTYLVIEEISRANASAVFGDIFQLLDLYSNSNGKVNKNFAGKSEYPIVNNQIGAWLGSNSGLLGRISIEQGLNISSKERKENKKLLRDVKSRWGNSKSHTNKIYLPKNFYIYATANLDDQNVHPMDSAFQRRFSWHYISTSLKDKSQDFKQAVKRNNPSFNIDDIKTNWIALFETLDKFINEEDKQIGPFFIKFKNQDKGNNNKYAKEYNEQQIKDKLLRYMWSNFSGTSLLPSNNGEILNPNIKSFDILNIVFSKSFGHNTSKKIFSNKFDQELKNNSSDKK